MIDPLLSGLQGHQRFVRPALEAIFDHPDKEDLKSLHAAVIVKGGSILAIAVNRLKRNSFIDVYAHHENMTLHAECAAVLKARGKINLRGAKMYVVRIKKDNSRLGISRPCPTCQRVIRAYGIKRVIYSNWDGELETVNSSEFIEEN